MLDLLNLIAWLIMGVEQYVLAKMSDFFRENKQHVWYQTGHNGEKSWELEITQSEFLLKRYDDLMLIRDALFLTFSWYHLEMSQGLTTSTPALPAPRRN